MVSNWRLIILCGQGAELGCHSLTNINTLTWDVKYAGSDVVSISPACHNTSRPPENLSICYGVSSRAGVRASLDNGPVCISYAYKHPCISGSASCRQCKATHNRIPHLLNEQHAVERLFSYVLEGVYNRVMTGETNHDLHGQDGPSRSSRS